MYCGLWAGLTFYLLSAGGIQVPPFWDLADQIDSLSEMVLTLTPARDILSESTGQRPPQGLCMHASDLCFYTQSVRNANVLVSISEQFGLDRVNPLIHFFYTIALVSECVDEESHYC